MTFNITDSFLQQQLFKEPKKYSLFSNELCEDKFINIYEKLRMYRVGSHRNGLGESVCFILCFDSVVVKSIALILSLLTCS